MTPSSPVLDTSDTPVFSGTSIIIVNGYTKPISSKATKPVRSLLSIEESADKYINLCCLMQNLGFKVYSELGAPKSAIERIVSEVKSKPAHKYASLVVILIGYSRKRKFICEDGLRLDVNTLYTALINSPVWSNKPKCFLFDTWCLRRSYFSRSFSHIYRTALPFPPRQEMQSKDSRQTAYLIITRNIPTCRSLQKTSDLNQDVITNILLQEAATIGCKVFDKFNQLSTLMLPVSQRSFEYNIGNTHSLSSNARFPANDDSVAVGKFLLRFRCEGRFLSTMTKTFRSVAKTKINHSLNLENQVWYHGYILLNRAEDRLHKDGDWLVRSSAAFDTYGLLYLSILQKSIIYHIPIRFHQMYSLCQEQMPQLSQLVAHYYEKNIPLLFNGIEILMKAYAPVLPPDSDMHFYYYNSRPTVSDELINPEIELVSQSWFYGWVSSEQIEPLLREEGDFVVRQTPSDNPFWGNFVISSLSRAQIQHTHVKLSSTGYVYIYKSQEFPTLCHLVAYHFNTQTPLPTTHSEVTALLKQYPINQYQPDPLIAMYTKYGQQAS